MKPFNDLTGREFGDLRVTGYAGSDKHRKARWWVYCEICTQVKMVRGDNLVSGKTKSCGCLRIYTAHILQKARQEWKRKMLADPEFNEMLNDPEQIEFLVKMAERLSKLVTKSTEELVTKQPPV